MLKQTNAVIGFSGIKYVREIEDNELGYCFLSEFWGQGIATEAGQASIEYVRRDPGFKRLVALVHPENAASARVVTTLGFRVERQVPYSCLHGVNVDLFARAL